MESINEMFIKRPEDQPHYDVDSIGFWLVERPYVWIVDILFPKNSKRLYLVYPDDSVFVLHISKGEEWGKIVSFNQIMYALESYRAFNVGHPAVSMLNVWGKKNIKQCEEILGNFFGVYIPQRDGPLSKLDVRVEGKKIKVKSDHETLVLKDHKIPVNGPLLIRK